MKKIRSGAIYVKKCNKAFEAGKIKVIRCFASGCCEVRLFLIWFGFSAGR